MPDPGVGDLGERVRGADHHHHSAHLRLPQEQKEVQPCDPVTNQAMIRLIQL